VRDLGDVLELLHTSPERWDSLRLEGRDWRNIARHHEAWERWVAAMQRDSGQRSVTGFASVSARKEGPELEDQVVKWRLWQAKPYKIRTEFEVGTETVTAVLVGAEWWSWSRSIGLRTNEGDDSSTHGVGPAEVLIETPRLLSFLRLRAVRRGRFMSRSAYIVSAEPTPFDRNGPPWVLHALGPGADKYDLTVDAEIGILLRSEAQLKRQPFRVVEVEQLALNEDFDQRLFTSDGLAG
jgi:hypothetical protein